ncbi:MAG: diaminopimelate epimerase [Wenzhouxiangella sp.]|nr:MAG: diaminopimelate epimerase [Wenzhouxiangella sp.]
MQRGRHFAKFEALGNDFVVFDQRAGGQLPHGDQVRALADRHTGVGFDQLLILLPASDPAITCSVAIYNRDGGSANQCGNGMRAIGLWLHQETPDQRDFVLETAAGIVRVRVERDGLIGVDMGHPAFDPAAVGLSDSFTSRALATSLPTFVAAGTVSMGNPHLVVLLARPATPELVERIGTALGRSPEFADGVNVSLACILADDEVDLRVWERGVGATRACGSAACAAAAWLLREQRVRGPVRVRQPGGELVINWSGVGRTLQMSGPARRVFDGTLR